MPSLSNSSENLNNIDNINSINVVIEKDVLFMLPWVIFGTGILYYCFAYLLRVYPSVMEHHLLAHFNVSESAFGWITSFYYFAYAPMQLPVGVTVDKIGARRSLMLGCLIATTGVFIFATTQVFLLALAGRFLIGMGCAFAYVTALKIASLWLPHRFFGTATGILTGSGMLAAIGTDNYLTHLIKVTSFQHVLLLPIYIGIGLFLCIALFVRNKGGLNADNQPIAMNRSYVALGRQLIMIMKTPQMWLIGLVGALMYLPSSVLVDAWAIPFLKTARHFSRTDAAFAASLTLAGWIISSFTAGFLSDYLKTRKIPLIIGSLGGIVVSSIVIFVPLAHTISMYIALFLLGICCGPQPLCFAMSKENCSHEISATAVSFANFVIMIGGMILQPAVGLFLVYLSHSTAQHTAYTSHDFSVALSIIPIGLVLAFLTTLFIKETYGNPS